MKMILPKRFALAARLLAVSLICVLCLGIMLGDDAKALADDGGNQSGRGTAKKLSTDLSTRAGDEQVKVILQLNDKPSGQLNALLNRNGVHVRANLRSLNMQVLELPASVAQTLADFDEVAYVSIDRPATASGHVSAATGADLVRNQTITTLSALGIAVSTNIKLDGRSEEHTSELQSLAYLVC